MKTEEWYEYGKTWKECKQIKLKMSKDKPTNDDGAYIWLTKIPFQYVAPINDSGEKLWISFMED